MPLEATARPPDLTVPVPPSDDLKSLGLALVQRAEAMKVRSKDEYELAGSFVRELARHIDAVKNRFAEGKKASDRLHRWICQLEHDLLDGPERMKKAIGRGMSDWEIEDDRRRRIEQARLQEEQRKKDEAARDAQAEALDRAGDTEAAVKVLDTPISPTPILLEKPKVAGVSSRSVWKFEVIDAAKVAPRFLCPDVAKIQGVVNGMKLEAAEVVGGIRVWEEKVIVPRR